MNNGGGVGGESITKVAARIWCTEDHFSTEESTQIVTDYRKSEVKKLVFSVACVVVAIIVAGISLGYGSLSIDFFDCYRIVWYHLTGDVQASTGFSTVYEYVVVNERLPRIVASLVTGAGLAVAGCVMQSVLRNPLADPYTTGISSGAGFGATLAITAGISLVGGSYSIVVNAFVFSLVPMAIMMAVSKMKGGDPSTMILAGMAVMYIFNAFTTVMKLYADPDALSTLYTWTVGTVSDCEWNDLVIMTVVVVVGVIVTQLMSSKLNILATGDDNAKAMGLNVENLRIGLLLMVSLVVATVVSFTGLIGFVGLVSPHICRMFVGSDNRFLVVSSAMFGAVLLLVADLIGRTVIAPAVLQVGVMTAFIGGPMFLYLILREKKSAW